MRQLYVEEVRLVFSLTLVAFMMLGKEDEAAYVP